MTKDFDRFTEQEEKYCQLRASGYNKTKAASIAYNTNHPNKVGWEVDQKEHIKERIRVLQEERAEAFGLDPQEQIRKYHEIYLEAMSKGKLETAMKALERLDALGGFEIKKSEVTRINQTKPGDVLKDEEGDIERDLQRFSTILGSHGKRPTHQGPKESQ